MVNFQSVQDRLGYEAFLRSTRKRLEVEKRILQEEPVSPMDDTDRNDFSCPDRICMLDFKEKYFQLITEYLQRLFQKQANSSESIQVLKEIKKRWCSERMQWKSTRFRFSKHVPKEDFIKVANSLLTSNTTQTKVVTSVERSQIRYGRNPRRTKKSKPSTTQTQDNVQKFKDRVQTEMKDINDHVSEEKDAKRVLEIWDGTDTAETNDLESQIVDADYRDMNALIQRIDRLKFK